MVITLFHNALNLFFSHPTSLKMVSLTYAAFKKMWVRFLCEVATKVIWDEKKLSGENSEDVAAGEVDLMDF